MGNFLKKYAIVQQMQMFKKETQGAMGIQHIQDLKTAKEINKDPRRTKNSKDQTANPPPTSRGLSRELVRQKSVTDAARWLPPGMLRPKPRGPGLLQGAGQRQLEEPASWVTGLCPEDASSHVLSSHVLSLSTSHQQCHSRSQSPLGNSWE